MTDEPTQIQSPLTVRDDARDVSPLDPPPPGFGRYQQARPLARGGMGQILEAVDPELRRAVAIKVLPAGGEDSYALRKFVAEARITGQLEHPNIVPAHELGRTPDGRLYFSMKLVRGRSLDRVLAEESGPEARTRHLRAFLKVLDAVGYAHSRGVVHRDLKPANVMVGEFGEVLVMDWGLAKVRGEEDGARASRAVSIGEEEIAPGGETLDGSILGTPAYMPPEQAAGDVRAVDERSDIYSLGAILYQILTGSTPYGGTSAREIVSRVQEGRLVPPSERAPRAGIPRELEAIALKAMAYDPADRYASTTALASDVEAWLGGFSVSAHRDSAIARLVKWSRRNRALVLGGAAALLALSVGVGGVVGWRQRGEAYELEALREELDEARADARAASAGRAWYEVHTRWLNLAREIDRATGVPPGKGRAAIEPARALARQLTEDGQYEMAGLLVDEARWAGLDPPLVELDLFTIEERSRRVASEPFQAILDRPDPSPPDRTAMADHLARGLRAVRPEVLRHLVPALFRGASWKRRFAAEAIGRIGDVRTPSFVAPGDIPESLPPGASPDPARADLLARIHAELRPRWQEGAAIPGIDPVAATALALLALDVAAEPDLALEMARALQRLGDPRGEEALAAKRLACGHGSPFWERTAGLTFPASPAASDARRLGLVRLARGDGAGAIAAWSGLPDDPDLAADLALALLVEGDAAGAEAELARASPDGHLELRGRVRLAAGDAAGARAAFERAISAGATPGAHLGLAAALESAGELDAAIESARRALGTDPRFAPAARRLARLLVRRERAHEAISVLTRAANLLPEDADLVAERACAWAALGDRDAVRADHERAFELASGSVEVRRTLARAYRALRETALPAYLLEDAVRLGSPSLELRIESADAWLDHCRYGRASAVGCRQTAERWSEILALAPGRAEFHLARGRARVGGGDFDGALADLDRAIALEPRLAAAYAERAAVRTGRRQAAEALEDLRRAHALDPRLARTQEVLASLAWSQKDYAAWIAALESAARLEPDWWWAWVDWGRGLLMAGRKEEAKATLERAHQLARPDDRKFVESWLALIR